MLHEILLSLSGHRSPIWEQVRDKSGGSVGLHTFVSEPEKAMLEVLGHVSELHLQVKEAAANIAAGHRSVLCRAVGSAIAEQQLGVFRKKVLQVESSILQRDAGYVGGYDIVPLSTVVGEFAPWTRRLEWLLSVTSCAEKGDRVQCNGKYMLDFLESETRTGYRDVEDMAKQLLVTAQKVWMRPLATWVLYGKLPAFGAQDFFIELNEVDHGAHQRYSVTDSLLPKYVSYEAAESCLATGIALDQIRQHEKGRNGLVSNGTSNASILAQSLRLLDSMVYPLNTSSLQLVLAEIDLLVSQNALSQILPVGRVLRILDVVHKYMLMDEGEFSAALIANAASRIAERSMAGGPSKPVRKIGRLDNVSIKEAELTGILTKTWDELAELTSEHVLDDDAVSYARDVLTLRSEEVSEHSAAPISTLLPNATVLGLDLPTDSTLHLFFTATDLKSYSTISAYLLSIRRTELHLSSLWTLTSQRRSHPTPVGPPVSATIAGRQALAARRSRESARQATMRQHWASASRALFVTNELDAYLHGEVIHNSWEHFQGWLQTGRDSSRPSTGRPQDSRPATASSAKSQLETSRASFDPLSQNRRRTDPRSLAKGHALFLKALYTGLLLDNELFVTSLKDLLVLLDHYIALFGRLQSIWQGLDLQEDDGVLDAFSNYAEDETAVLGEMSRSRQLVENALASLVDRLKEAEKTRLMESMTDGVSQLDLERHNFVPWRSRTMDRLIMKLVFLSGDPGADETENLVEGLDDD